MSDSRCNLTMSTKSQATSPIHGTPAETVVIRVYPDSEKITKCETYNNASPAFIRRYGKTYSPYGNLTPINRKFGKTYSGRINSKQNDSPLGHSSRNESEKPVVGHSGSVGGENAAPAEAFTIDDKSYTLKKVSGKNDSTCSKNVIIKDHAPKLGGGSKEENIIELATQSIKLPCDKQPKKMIVFHDSSSDNKPVVLYLLPNSEANNSTVSNNTKTVSTSAAGGKSLLKDQHQRSAASVILLDRTLSSSVSIVHKDPASQRKNTLPVSVKKEDTQITKVASVISDSNTLDLQPQESVLSSLKLLKQKDILPVAVGREEFRTDVASQLITVDLQSQNNVIDVPKSTNNSLSKTTKENSLPAKIKKSSIPDVSTKATRLLEPNKKIVLKKKVKPLTKSSGVSPLGSTKSDSVPHKKSKGSSSASQEICAHTQTNLHSSELENLNSLSKLSISNNMESTSKDKDNDASSKFSHSGQPLKKRSIDGSFENDTIVKKRKKKKEKEKVVTKKVKKRKLKPIATDQTGVIDLNVNSKKVKKLKLKPITTDSAGMIDLTVDSKKLKKHKLKPIATGQTGVIDLTVEPAFVDDNKNVKISKKKKRKLEQKKMLKKENLLKSQKKGKISKLGKQMKKSSKKKANFSDPFCSDVAKDGDKVENPLLPKLEKYLPIVPKEKKSATETCEKVDSDGMPVLEDATKIRPLLGDDFQTMPVLQELEKTGPFIAVSPYKLEELERKFSPKTKSLKFSNDNNTGKLKLSTDPNKEKTKVSKLLTNTEKSKLSKLSPDTEKPKLSKVSTDTNIENPKSSKLSTNMGKSKLSTETNTEKSKLSTDTNTEKSKLSTDTNTEKSKLSTDTNTEKSKLSTGTNRKKSKLSTGTNRKKSKWSKLPTHTEKSKLLSFKFSIDNNTRELVSELLTNMEKPKLSTDTEKSKLSKLSPDTEKPKLSKVSTDTNTEKSKLSTDTNTEKSKLSKLSTHMEKSKLSTDTEKPKMLMLSTDTNTEKSKLSTDTNTEKSKLSTDTNTEKSKLSTDTNTEKSKLSTDTNTEKSKLSKLSTHMEKSKLSTDTEKPKMLMLSIGTNTEKSKLSKLSTDMEKSKLSTDTEKPKMLMLLIGTNTEESKLSKLSSDREKPKMSKLSTDTEKSKLSTDMEKSKFLRLSSDMEKPTLLMSSTDSNKVKPTLSKLSLGAEMPKLSIDTNIENPKSSKLSTNTGKSKLSTETNTEKSKLSTDTNIEKSKLSTDTNTKKSKLSTGTNRKKNPKMLSIGTNTEESQESRLSKILSLKVSIDNNTRELKLSTDPNKDPNKEKTKVSELLTNMEKPKLSTNTEKSKLSILSPDTEKPKLSKVSTDTNTEKSKLSTDTNTEKSKLSTETNTEKSKLSTDTNTEKSKLSTDTNTEKSKLSTDTNTEKCKSSKLSTDTEKSKLSKLSTDMEKSKFLRLSPDMEKPTLLMSSTDSNKVKLTLLKLSLGAEKPKMPKLSIDTNIENPKSSKLSTNTGKSKLSKLSSDTNKGKSKLSTDTEKSKLSTDTEKSKLSKLSTDMEKSKLSTDLEKSKLSTDTEKSKLSKLSTDLEKSKLSTDMEKSKLSKLSTDTEKSKLSTDMEKSKLSTDLEKSKLSTDTEKSKLSKLSTDTEKSKLSKLSTDTEKSKLSKLSTDLEKSKLSTDTEKSKLSKDMEKSKLLKLSTDMEKSKLSTDMEKSKFSRLSPDMEKPTCLMSSTDSNKVKPTLSKLSPDTEKPKMPKLSIDTNIEKPNLSKLSTDTNIENPKLLTESQQVSCKPLNLSTEGDNVKCSHSFSASEVEGKNSSNLASDIEGKQSDTPALLKTLKLVKKLVKSTKSDDTHNQKKPAKIEISDSPILKQLSQMKNFTLSSMPITRNTELIQETSASDTPQMFIQGPVLPVVSVSSATTHAPPNSAITTPGSQDSGKYVSANPTDTPHGICKTPSSNKTENNVLPPNSKIMAESSPLPNAPTPNSASPSSSNPISAADPPTETSAILSKSMSISFSDVSTPRDAMPATSEMEDESSNLHLYLSPEHRDESLYPHPEHNLNPKPKKLCGRHKKIAKLADQPVLPCENPTDGNSSHAITPCRCKNWPSTDADVCCCCPKPPQTKAEAVERCGGNCEISTRDPLSCNVCNCPFTNPSDLNKHMKWHLGPDLETRTNGCRLCGKKFQLGVHLRQHMPWQTGQKPHKCSNCQQDFSSISKLHVHVCPHTTDKPFKCPDCPSEFSESGHLVDHLADHQKKNGHSFSLLQIKDLDNTQPKNENNDTCDSKKTRLPSTSSSSLCSSSSASESAKALAIARQEKRQSRMRMLQRHLAGEDAADVGIEQANKVAPTRGSQEPVSTLAPKTAENCEGPVKQAQSPVAVPVSLSLPKIQIDPQIMASENDHSVDMNLKVGRSFSLGIEDFHAFGSVESTHEAHGPNDSEINTDPAKGTAPSGQELLVSDLPPPLLTPQNVSLVTHADKTLTVPLKMEDPPHLPKVSSFCSLAFNNENLKNRTSAISALETGTTVSNPVKKSVSASVPAMSTDHKTCAAPSAVNKAGNEVDVFIKKEVCEETDPKEWESLEKNEDLTSDTFHEQERVIFLPTGGQNSSAHSRSMHLLDWPRTIVECSVEEQPDVGRIQEAKSSRGQSEGTWSAENGSKKKNSKVETSELSKKRKLSVGNEDSGACKLKPCPSSEKIQPTVKIEVLSENPVEIKQEPYFGIDDVNNTGEGDNVSPLKKSVSSDQESLDDDLQKLKKEKDLYGMSKRNLSRLPSEPVRFLPKRNYKKPQKYFCDDFDYSITGNPMKPKISNPASAVKGTTTTTSNSSVTISSPSQSQSSSCELPEKNSPNLVIKGNADHVQNDKTKANNNNNNKSKKNNDDNKSNDINNKKNNNSCKKKTNTYLQPQETEENPLTPDERESLERTKRKYDMTKRNLKKEIRDKEKEKESREQVTKTFLRLRFNMAESEEEFEQQQQQYHKKKLLKNATIKKHTVIPKMAKARKSPRTSPRKCSESHYGLAKMAQADQRPFLSVVTNERKILPGPRPKTLREEILENLISYNFVANDDASPNSNLKKSEELDVRTQPTQLSKLLGTPLAVLPSAAAPHPALPHHVTTATTTIPHNSSSVKTIAALIPVTLSNRDMQIPVTVLTNPLQTNNQFFMGNLPAPPPENTEPSPLREDTEPAPLPEVTVPAPLQEHSVPAPLTEKTAPVLLPENTVPAPLPEDTELDQKPVLSQILPLPEMQPKADYEGTEAFLPIPVSRIKKEVLSDDETYNDKQSDGLSGLRISGVTGGVTTHDTIPTNSDAICWNTMSMDSHNDDLDTGTPQDWLVTRRRPLRCTLVQTEDGHNHSEYTFECCGLSFSQIPELASHLDSCHK